MDKGPKDKIYDIDLSYLTSRGKWYFTSWKGDISKSGGIATNIGVHFFDMLQWIFGEMESFTIIEKSRDTNSGTLTLKRARVNWFLSINSNNLPMEAKNNGLTTHRVLSIEGEQIEFSKGFTDLHTVSYQNILNGNSYGLGDAKNSIEIVSQIRNKK